mmetsp:Transcript_11173/g.12630  ORF Transcript_11173/g.12630 Transcript_11173/m.12630 type:complete len:155 (-) Transcript_11173:329-793(-)
MEEVFLTTAMNTLRKDFFDFGASIPSLNSVSQKISDLSSSSPYLAETSFPPFFTFQNSCIEMKETMEVQKEKSDKLNQMKKSERVGFTEQSKNFEDLGQQLESQSMSNLRSKENVKMKIVRGEIQKNSTSQKPRKMKGNKADKYAKSRLNKYCT